MAESDPEIVDDIREVYFLLIVVNKLRLNPICSIWILAMNSHTRMNQETVQSQLHLEQH